MSSLESQLRAMGLSMPRALQEKALDFLRILKKWNHSYNLTAIDDFNTMVKHHLLDSLSLVPYLQTKRILDVGTGAGFPGIPLALYYPNKQFTLLDSNGKKTRFLLQAIAELSINNVNVVQSRAENFKTEFCFDAIISRAVASISEIVLKTQHLCCKGGKIFAMKGAYPAKELETFDRPFLVQVLAVPGLNAKRHLIIIEGVAGG